MKLITAVDFVTVVRAVLVFITELIRRNALLRWSTEPGTNWKHTKPDRRRYTQS